MAPAIIAPWFPHRRGIALSIWATWVPVGLLTMLLVAPTLASWGDWPNVWWFGCIYAVLTTLLFLLVVRPAPAQGAVATTPGPSVAGRTLHIPAVWWLGATFACYCTAVFAIGTFLPTYLYTMPRCSVGTGRRVDEHHLADVHILQTAGGLISDRIGSRKRVYLFGLIAAAIILRYRSRQPADADRARSRAGLVPLRDCPKRLRRGSRNSARYQRPRAGDGGGHDGAGRRRAWPARCSSARSPRATGRLGGWHFASLPVVCLLGVLAGVRAKVR